MIIKVLIVLNNHLQCSENFQPPLSEGFLTLDNKHGVCNNLREMIINSFTPLHRLAGLKDNRLLTVITSFRYSQNNL